MSPLSNVQFSRFSETEAGKLFTFGSNGALEAMVPMTDDDRRDMELYLKGHVKLSLAVQIKARHVLVVHNRAKLLIIRFAEKPERLITSPFFWYFFGYMDIATMQYRAPVFFVPSTVVHREADPHPWRSEIRFNFSASLDPRSKDKWHSWACDPAEVADRAMKFLREQERGKLGVAAAAASMAPMLQQPGTILVGRR